MMIENFFGNESFDFNYDIKIIPKNFVPKLKPKHDGIEPSPLILRLKESERRTR